MKDMHSPAIIHLLAAVVLLVIQTNAQANHEALRYKSMSFFGLSINQGLSQVSGNTVLQDRTGYIWIGTQDGLNRYDGHEVKVFRHERDNPESLGRDFINVLAEDPEGHLWIGTRGKGLDEYDPLTRKFHHYLQTGSGKDRSAADVRTLEIIDGNLLVGTLQGLFALNLGNREITPIALGADASPPYTIHDLIKLPDNRILVASSGGLHFLDLHSRQSTPAFTQLLGNFPGGIKVLFLDSRQRLWLATDHQGVLLVNPKTGALIREFHYRGKDPESLTSPSASAFTEDSHGNIWIGSSAGLNIYLHQKGQLIRIADAKLRPEGMTDHTVRSLYTDLNGTVWVGTHVGGINHVTPHLVRFGKENPSRYLNSHDKRILGVAVTNQGDMYVGTVEGLVRRRAGHKAFEPVPLKYGQPSTEKYSVYGVHVSRDGTVWAGSTTGLRRLAPGEDGLGPVELESPYYFVSILDDAEGYLWLGRPTELLKYDPRQRRIVARLEIPHVYGLLLLDAEHLLVGGLGALYMVDTQGARILGSLEGSTHGFNTITYLFRSKDGSIRGGTQGDGLFELYLPKDLDLNKATLTFHTTQDGLLSNAIGAIQQSDDGNLWISTINSISQLDPGTGAIRNFDARDGAFSEGYFIGSGAMDQQGLIYFGGTVGLTVFSPEWIHDDPSNPRIIFTDLKLDNHSIQPGQEYSPLNRPMAYTHKLAITPHWSNISLSFSSDNYASPFSQRYAYRMLGLEEDWTETDAEHRYASYTNLPPGSYRFQVKTTNLDGQWSIYPGEVDIIIEPDWYQTPWAWLLFLLITGGTLYGFVRWRMAGLLKRNIELEKRVSERTRALTEANRKLSHLARTDTLTGLLNRRAFTELFPGNSHSPHSSDICSLALLDIDLFKQFNDNYGHDCGDAVLREMARLLKANLRQHDIVARWGGEEFIVLLPDTELDVAAEIMERLRKTVAAHQFKWKNQNLQICITVGLGICTGNNLDASLLAVDQALFRGKEEGRNRLVVTTGIAAKDRSATPNDNRSD